MGLRVGAGAGDLSTPGAPTQTLAGLQNSAAIPAAPPMRAPASAAAAPATGDPNVEKMIAMMQAGKSAPVEPGLQAASSPMPERPGGMIRSIISGFREHPGEMAGMALGGMTGRAIGGEGPILGTAAEAVGAGLGAAAGRAAIDNYGKGKNNTFQDAAVTATQQAIMQGVASTAARMIEGAPATAIDPEKIGAGAKAAVHDAMQVASQLGITPFKHEVIPPGAAPVAQKTLAEQAIQTASGGKGPAAQAVYEQQYLHNKTVLQGFLQNIHNMLPEPTDPHTAPADFMKTNMENKGRIIGDYNDLIRESTDGVHVDVTQLLDALGAGLRKDGIIRPSGALMAPDSIPPEWGHKIWALNLYQDMMRASGRPVSGTESTDAIWNAISKAPERISGMNMPDVIRLTTEPSASTLDFQTFHGFLRRLQTMAASSGDNLLTYPSKIATDKYYSSVEAALQQNGYDEAASHVRAANQEYSAYMDFKGRFGNQLEKNPDSAVDVMVNKTNPTDTAKAMRLLNDDQRKSLGWAFISSIGRSSTDEQGAISAPKMLKSIQEYGDKNLDLVFGDQKDSVLKTLKIVGNMQKENISPQAAEALADQLKGQLAKSPIMGRALQWIKGMVDKNPNIKGILADDDWLNSLSNMKQANRSQMRQAAGTAARRAAPLATGPLREAREAQPEQNQSVGYPQGGGY